MSRRDRYEKLWLRSHGAAERRLQTALRLYFSDQAERAAERIRNGVSTPDQVLDWAAEHDSLIATVRPWLLRGAAQGASVELALFEGRRPKKAADDGVASRFNLPADVFTAIDRTISQTMKQRYWQGVGATTRANIHDALLAGIDEGDSQDQLATRIRQALAGSGAEERALTIARTESTGALNGGHAAAREQLIQEGLVAGSEWSTMGDDIVREDHADADGQTIGAHDLFVVGGESCPYPGYFGLSAAQRINCRCTHVAAGIFAADE
jgi:uncharacterized protein with gpF-like domain